MTQSPKLPIIDNSILDLISPINSNVASSVNSASTVNWIVQTDLERELIETRRELAEVKALKVDTIVSTNKRSDKRLLRKLKV